MMNSKQNPNPAYSNTSHPSSSKTTAPAPNYFVDPTAAEFLDNCINNLSKYVDAGRLGRFSDVVKGRPGKLRNPASPDDPMFLTLDELAFYLGQVELQRNNDLSIYYRKKCRSAFELVDCESQPVDGIRKWYKAVTDINDSIRDRLVAQSSDAQVAAKLEKHCQAIKIRRLEILNKQAIDTAVRGSLFRQDIDGGVNEDIITYGAQRMRALVEDSQFHGRIKGGVNNKLRAGGIPE